MPLRSAGKRPYLAMGWWAGVTSRSKNPYLGMVRWGAGNHGRDSMISRLTQQVSKAQTPFTAPAEAPSLDAKPGRGPSRPGLWSRRSPGWTQSRLCPGTLGFDRAHLDDRTWPTPQPHLHRPVMCACARLTQVRNSYGLRRCHTNPHSLFRPSSVARLPRVITGSSNLYSYHSCMRFSG